MFAIKYKDEELYLKLQFVDYANKRSKPTLTDTNFDIFSTREAASQNIILGNELFFNYEEMSIDKDKLEIVGFAKIKE